jgi:biopolymer transport protein ExbD
MLVISFRASDFDKALVLPVVGSAAPADEATTGEFLILNLRAGGKLFVQGKEEPNVEGFLNFEAQKLQKALKADSEEFVTVVIRADRALRCEFLMRIINACKKSGLNRFDFMVLRGGEQQSG